MPDPTNKDLLVRILDFNLLFRSIFVQKVPCLNIAVRLVKALVALLVEGHGDQRHLGVHLRANCESDGAELPRTCGPAGLSAPASPAVPRGTVSFH